MTGEQQAIKSSRRKPNIKITGSVNNEKVVIVGGGSGALGTVEALRENGYKGSITLVSSEGYTPFDRTKLSKALIDDHSKIALRDEAWFKDGSVDFVKDEVTDVDFSGKKVSTKNGSKLAILFCQPVFCIFERTFLITIYRLLLIHKARFGHWWQPEGPPSAWLQGVRQHLQAQNYSPRQGYQRRHR